MAVQRACVRQGALWGRHVEGALAAAVAAEAAESTGGASSSQAAAATRAGRLVSEAASLLSAGPAAATDALLRLQALAWALAPALAAAAAEEGPLDAFRASDALAALAVVLASGPTPLRLLVPPPPLQAEAPPSPSLLPAEV